MPARAWTTALLASAACAAPRAASAPDAGAGGAPSHATVVTVTPPTAEDVRGALAAYEPVAPPPPPRSPPERERLDVAVRTRARACLLRSALARDPGERGRVTVRLVMGDDDVVASAGGAGSSLRDRAVVACLVASMVGVRVVVHDQELAAPILLERGTAVTMSIVFAP